VTLGSAISQLSTSGKLSANGSARVLHQCLVTVFLRPLGAR
jgi:hypothetical protein